VNIVESIELSELCCIFNMTILSLVALLREKASFRSLLTSRL
jgi:hypothetical protein